MPSASPESSASTSRFLRVAAQCAKRALGFGDDVRVALLLAKLDQLDAVVESRFELGVGVDGVVELLALAHDVAGALRDCPKARESSARAFSS